MEKLPRYDVARWIVHCTENDCTLIVRSSNGRAFYCEADPSRFVQSPKLTERYLKCINLLRSDEEEEEDEEDEEDEVYDEETACDWLLKLFEPLIVQLAPAPSPVPEHGRPTLSQYLFPLSFVCGVAVADEVPRPYQEKSRDHGWGRPGVRVRDAEFLRDLDKWTRSYHPSDVDIIYNRPEDVLIKPPGKVVVDAGNGDMITCHFKEFRGSGPAQAKKELMTLGRIAMAQMPPAPEAWICRLHGVVRDGNQLMGMLFTWIDQRGVLSKARAEASSSALRNRWKAQISTSLEMLHSRGIIWGDAKAENILIDKDDNAWIIDFGGSYTPGWVDKEKAETLEGDAQGLEKMLSFLQ